MSEAEETVPRARVVKPTFWWWLVSFVVVPVLSSIATWSFKRHEIELAEHQVTLQATGLLAAEEPQRALAALTWIGKSGDADVSLALADVSLYRCTQAYREYLRAVPKPPEESSADLPDTIVVGPWTNTTFAQST